MRTKCITGSRDSEITIKYALRSEKAVKLEEQIPNKRTVISKINMQRQTWKRYIYAVGHLWHLQRQEIRHNIIF